MGSVDAPADPISMANGSALFQGWALDLWNLRRVRIEYTRSGRAVTIGETHGSFMRPDVAAIFPNAHDIFNSGWSFWLEAKALWRVDLPVTLHFYAESGDGRAVEIGTRTVTEK